MYRNTTHITSAAPLLTFSKVQGDPRSRLLLSDFPIPRLPAFPEGQRRNGGAGRKIGREVCLAVFLHGVIFLAGAFAVQSEMPPVQMLTTTIFMAESTDFFPGGTSGTLQEAAFLRNPPQDRTNAGQTPQKTAREEATPVVSSSSAPEFAKTPEPEHNPITVPNDISVAPPLPEERSEPVQEKPRLERAAAPARKEKQPAPLPKKQRATSLAEEKLRSASPKANPSSLQDARDKTGRDSDTTSGLTSTTAVSAQNSGENIRNSGASGQLRAGSANVPFGARQGPGYRQFVTPIYPLQAKRQGISGKVVLRVYITPDGKAGDIQVVQSPSDILTQAATHAVRESTFHPYTREGRAEACWTVLPVLFRLDMS